MSYEDIRFEVSDGVAIIKLHRPEHLNAYCGKMGVELGDAYRTCDSDDAIRAVVVTGAGRAFCAGADMSLGEKTFAQQDRQTFSAAGANPPAFEVRKPVIAAMNGHAGWNRPDTGIAARYANRGYRRQVWRCSGSPGSDAGCLFTLDATEARRPGARCISHAHRVHNQWHRSYAD